MAISFPEARQIILNAALPLDVERVPLLEAAGRAAAEDITAPFSLPPLDNSAMDGYAVIAGSSVPEQPLRLKGFLPAGTVSQESVEPGTAIKIMTGAPLPPGADAVIPFEKCAEPDPQTVILHNEVQAGDNIRHSGEDLRQGDPAIAAGQFLRPAEINLLAALRQATVPVRRRVRVAILATGDELQEIDELHFAGSVVNSNSWALAAAVREIGGIPLLLGIARDNQESLRQKISEGLQADVLLTSAGVSTGDRDLVRDVLAESGVKELFWKVRIRPGHPTAFGVHGNIPVFSLPGNPVATMLIFEALVRPALLRMMGHRNAIRTIYRATLTEPMKKKPGRLQIVRVVLRQGPDGELLAASAGDQSTGIISTLVNCQGLALLPEDQEHYDVGDKIDVHFLGASTAMGY